MKVTFEKEYKNYFTLTEIQICKEMQKGLKEYESSAAEDLEMLAREVLKGTEDHTVEVLKASAVFARNRKAWNAYSDTSEHMDVWLEGTVETVYGFLKVGGYLSDVWQIGAEDIRGRIWSRYYTES